MTFASQPYITATGCQRFANMFTASTLTSSRLKQALAEGAKRNTPHYGGCFGSDDIIITNNKPKKKKKKLLQKVVSCSNFSWNSWWNDFWPLNLQHQFGDPSSIVT